MFNGLELDYPVLAVDYHSISWEQPLEGVLQQIKQDYHLSKRDLLVSTSFGSFLATHISSNHLAFAGILELDETSWIYRLGLHLHLFKYSSVGGFPHPIIRTLFGIRTEEDLNTFVSMCDSYSGELLDQMSSHLLNTSSPWFKPLVRVHGLNDHIISYPKNVDLFFGCFCVALNAMQFVSDQKSVIQAKAYGAFQEPWAMVFVSNQELLITEKPGTLKL